MSNYSLNENESDVDDDDLDNISNDSVDDNAEYSDNIYESDVDKISENYDSSSDANANADISDDPSSFIAELNKKDPNQIIEIAVDLRKNYIQLLNISKYLSDTVDSFSDFFSDPDMMGQHLSDLGHGPHTIFPEAMQDMIALLNKLYHAYLDNAIENNLFYKHSSDSKNGMNSDLYQHLKDPVAIKEFVSDIKSNYLDTHKDDPMKTINHAFDPTSFYNDTFSDDDGSVFKISKATLLKKKSDNQNNNTSKDNNQNNNTNKNSSSSDDLESWFKKIKEL